MYSAWLRWSQSRARKRPRTSWLPAWRARTSWQRLACAGWSESWAAIARHGTTTHLSRSCSPSWSKTTACQRRLWRPWQACWKCAWSRPKTCSWGRDSFSSYRRSFIAPKLTKWTEIGKLVFGHWKLTEAITLPITIGEWHYSRIRVIGNVVDSITEPRKNNWLSSWLSFKKTYVVNNNKDILLCLEEKVCPALHMLLFNNFISNSFNINMYN